MPGIRVLLKQCTPDNLLDLAQDVMDMIPESKLTGLDVGQALLIQHAILSRLQGQVLDDKDIPPNQKAQVANSVGAILQKIAKMQSEQYTSERFKQIEVAMINMLNSWPPEQTADFLEEYQKLSP